MGAEAQHWASQNRKQKWLPPCDNYITGVLLQSDTAGYYRALGDQVNMGKHGVQAGSTDTFCRKLQGAHQDSSIKNYVKYKVSASIVISWGLSS